MRTVLVIEYDISDLTEDEAESLTGEALAQAERTKGEGGHPSVDVLDSRVERRPS